MTRTKIRLDTMSDVNMFIVEMNKLPYRVWLEDGDGSRVSAKSMLGLLHSLEWDHVYCYCEHDISYHLMPWIV